MDFRTLEESAWSEPAVAAAYADHFIEVTVGTVDRLLARAHVGRGARLLDVACGPGNVSAAATAVGAVTTGVDFSPAMIARARADHPRLTFEVGNAQSLPFPNGAFDAVVCNFGLLHFDRPDDALAEAARVLRPGGLAAFTVWTESGVLCSVIPRTIRELGYDPGLPSGPDFFRYANAEGFAASLARAGLSPQPSEVVAWPARLGSIDEFWGMFEEGSARTRASLRGLPPDQLRRVHQKVTVQLNLYASPKGLAIPAEAIIGTGQKPPG